MELKEDLAPVANNRRQLPFWVYALAFVVLLGFLGLIAWGLKVSQAGPISIGQQVPSFDLQTFEGQKLNTGEMAGKVIVVNFWASWCKPCEQEADELEASWKYYQPGGQVVFLGVDYVDTEPEARAYLDKFAISYPNGPDLRTTISQLFHIRGVPETYFIDRSGKLAFVQIGPFNSTEDIQAEVDRLLQ
jgi:cytochrome c biogenesis protein CcmG/thiol:disulfide interchange protein DsbE